MSDYEPGSVLHTPAARRIAAIGRELLQPGLMSEELLEHARDTLSQWLGDYTEPLSDGLQRRIIILGEEDDHVDFRTEISGTPEGRHAYRIRLTIEELPE